MIVCPIYIAITSDFKKNLIKEDLAELPIFRTPHKLLLVDHPG